MPKIPSRNEQREGKKEKKRSYDKFEDKKQTQREILSRIFVIVHICFGFKHGLIGHER